MEESSRESVDQASDKGRYAKVTHIEELPPRKGHSKQGEICVESIQLMADAEAVSDHVYRSW